MGRQEIVNYWDFPSKISRNCHKSLVPKINRHDFIEMFAKLSLRERLVCTADFVGMTLLVFFSPATSTQLFSQSLFSHILCSCLGVFSTTKNACNFWHSKFQQVSTYTFCSWDDILTRKTNCTSLNKLCKCTKTAPKLSTTNSIERISTCAEATIL